MASRKAFIRPPRLREVAYADSPVATGSQEDGTILVDTSAGAVEIDLPAVPEDASIMAVGKAGTDANTLTITAGAGTTVAGGATLATSLTSLPFVILQYDKTNTNWIILADTGFKEADAAVPLTSAHILVGNAGGRAADVAMSGDATIDNTGLVSVKMKLGAAVTGQSPAVAGVPSDLTVNVSGTVQSTFYALNSVIIPANAMSVNGKGINFTFMGTTAANANAKDFRLAFGTHQTTLATGLTGSGVAFYLSGSIFRTGVGAQILVAEITVGNAAPFPVCAALVEDETTALTLALQSQNTAAAAASATGKGAIVTFQN